MTKTVTKPAAFAAEARQAGWRATAKGGTATAKRGVESITITWDGAVLERWPRYTNGKISRIILNAASARRLLERSPDEAAEERANRNKRRRHCQTCTCHAEDA